MLQFDSKSIENPKKFVSLRTSLSTEGNISANFHTHDQNHLPCSQDMKYIGKGKDYNLIILHPTDFYQLNETEEESLNQVESMDGNRFIRGFSLYCQIDSLEGANENSNTMQKTSSRTQVRKFKLKFKEDSNENFIDKSVIMLLFLLTAWFLFFLTFNISFSFV